MPWQIAASRFRSCGTFVGFDVFRAASERRTTNRAGLPVAARPPYLRLARRTRRVFTNSERDLAFLAVRDRLEPLVDVVIEAALPRHGVALLPGRLLERLHGALLRGRSGVGLDVGIVGA